MTKTRLLKNITLNFVKVFVALRKKSRDISDICMFLMSSLKFSICESRDKHHWIKVLKFSQQV